MHPDLIGTSSPSSFPGISETLPETSSTPIDTKVYENKDTMSSVLAENVQQQFAPKTDYDTKAQNPVLLKPDPEGKTGPQPYGTDERLVIMNVYISRVKELLESKKRGFATEDIDKILECLLGKKPLPPHLQNQLSLIEAVSEQAKMEIRKRERLPESWDPSSKSVTDWTPSPLQPYGDEKQSEINQYFDATILQSYEEFKNHAQPPLTEEQIKFLDIAIKGGKVDSSIVEMFISIKQTATQATQKAYGLSETWVRGTTNIEDWKPVHLSSLSTESIKKTRTDRLILNMQDFLDQLQKAGDQLVTLVRSEHQLDVDNYRKIVAQAMRDVKQLLREIQQSEADLARKTSELKLDLVSARFDEMEKARAKNEEMKKKQEEMEKISSCLQWGGLGLGIAAAIVGIVICVVTGGAAIPLVIAGIAVLLATTAYTIIDKETQCTSKLLDLIAEQLEHYFPDNAFAQAVAKIVLLVAVILVLIFIIGLTCGAGTGIAASVGAQITKEVVKQIAIQALIMAIMASNAIPEFVREVAKKEGMSEEDAKILEYIAMAVTILTVMLASVYGAKSGAKVPNAVTEGVEQGVNAANRTFMQAAQNAIKQMREMIAKIKEGIIEVTEETIKALKKLWKQVVETFKDLASAIAQLPSKIAESIRNSYNRLEESLKELMVLLKDPQKFKEATKASLEAALNKFEHAMHEFAETSVKAFEKTREVAKKAKDIAADELETAINKSTEMGKKLLENAMARGIKEAENLYHGYKEILGGLIKHVPKLFSAERAEHAIPAGISVQKSINLTSMTVNIADGIVRGVYNLEISDLYKEIGDITESEMVLQATIELFGKILNAIYASLNEAGSDITQMQREFNKFYKLLEEGAAGKIFQGQV